MREKSCKYLRHTLHLKSTYGLESLLETNHTNYILVNYQSTLLIYIPLLYDNAYFYVLGSLIFYLLYIFYQYISNHIN